MAYLTMTNVKAVNDPEGIVEQIGHCVGYCPKKEESILPSVHLTTVFEDVDELFPDDLEAMSGPSANDLAEIEKEFS